MKNLFALIINLFFVTLAFSQSNAVDKLFSEESRNRDFKYVAISERMFGSIANTDVGDKDVQDIVSNLKGLKILQTNINAMEFHKNARIKLSSSDYDELMSVRDGGSDVDFFIRGVKGNIADELVLLVGKRDKTVLLSFTGSINLDKMSKMGSALNLEGAQMLDKLDK